MIENEEISHPPDTPANVLLRAVRGVGRKGRMRAENRIRGDEGGE